MDTLKAGLVVISLLTTFIIFVKFEFMTYNLGYLLPTNDNRYVEDMYDPAGWQWDQYTPPEAASVTKTGLQFPVNITHLPTSFINLTHYNLTDFVFVTAASKNHFWESNEAVAGLQHRFPNHRIIYYDIGLTTEQQKMIKSWCRVELRRFQFDNYPSHVKKAPIKAFKPIVIYEVVQEFGAACWHDASIRQFESPKNWTPIYEMARSNGGIAALTSSELSVAVTTYPAMYDYLPSDVERLNHTRELQSGAVLIYNTEYIYKNVLHWWYLCALTRACIAPEGHPWRCQGMGDKLGKEPIACHRYDQSALAVLTSNLYAYNVSRCCPRFSNFVWVYRKRRKSSIVSPYSFQLQLCG